MSVVDFSLLENPIDNAMEGLLSTEADPHHQLHTPPLVMDADKEENSPHAASSPKISIEPILRSVKEQTKAASKKDSEQVSDQAESSDDGQQTAGNSQEETLTETDLYSDSNMGRDSPLVPPPEARPEIAAMRTLKKSDSVSTEDSFTCETASQRAKRKPSKRPSLKLKLKKVNSESSSEAPENQTESGDERSKQRKRRKVEQSEQYRFRSKRTSVDYSSDAYSHMYKEDKAKEEAAQNTKVKERKRKVKTREPVQYIIINRFKGYKSMRVLLERMDVKANETVHLSDLSRRKRRKRQHTSQTSTSSFGMLRQIVSDVPHENQSDPLWEAQIERLGGDDGDADVDAEDEDGSSDDDSSQDSTNAEDSRSRKGHYHAAGVKGGPKKRVMSLHKRMSNAFCGTKTRRTKRKSDKTKSEQTKIWNTLSLLHDATVAQLSSPNTTYADEAEKDHKTEFVDVMYKLALFSPPQSEHGGDSPPQPLSPGCPTEEQESAIQKQDEGPRKTPSAAYHTAMKSSLLHQSSIDDSTSEILPLTKSPVQALKSSARSSAANSPSGSDPEAHFSSRQALALSEYNSSGMNANNTGSPYAVKEAIVHFNPSKASLFNQSKGYGKDTSPPDLGPPTLHQMSPHSLGSNTGSPPELVQQEKDQAQHQNQSSNSASLDAYANFFGPVASTGNTGKGSKTHSAAGKQPQGVPAAKECGSRRERSPRKGSAVSSVAQEKKESASKGPSRSLSLKKSRSGSSSRPVDLTTPDLHLSIAQATSGQTNVNSKEANVEKDGMKEQPRTGSRGRPKGSKSNKEDVNSKVSTSKSSSASVEEKGYEKQPPKKMVLARTGIDIQALRQQEEQNKSKKEEKEQDKKTQQKKSKTTPKKSTEPSPQEKDRSSKELRENRKSTEKVVKTKNKKVERQTSSSSKTRGRKRVVETSESSEEEEYTCIRSQTPPQSPVECEPPRLERMEPSKGPQKKSAESSSSSSEDEDDDTEEEEEESRPKAMVNMTPIRSPSPVPFNVRCDMAVPLVPIATPRHPGASPWDRAPPSVPDGNQGLRAPIYVPKRMGDSPGKSEPAKLPPKSENVNKTRETKPEKLEEKGKNIGKGVQMTESTVSKNRQEVDASSQDSDDETEDEESDSERRNCHRIDSPIRSPSPERRHSITEEETVSKQPKLPTEKSSIPPSKIPRESNLDVKPPTVPTEQNQLNESQNLSASELFSPENQSDVELFSPEATETETKQTKGKDTESSTECDDSEEEDSEEDEKSPQVVCSPIRSLSPPQSPTGPNVEDDQSQQLPVRAIPTNLSEKQKKVTAKNEKGGPVKTAPLDTSFESTEDEEDPLEKCERLSSPIRSPSPPPSSPTPTQRSLSAEKGLSSQEQNQSASDLFSPDPLESISSPEKQNEISGTKDLANTKKDDKKEKTKEESRDQKGSSKDSANTRKATASKGKQESSDSEDEETDEDSDETENEEIGDFSPIRSPSPPPIASPPPMEEEDISASSQPAEIPASVIGSPRPDIKSNFPASPEPMSKKSANESKPALSPPAEAAKELEALKGNDQTSKEALVSSKRHVFLAPLDSPNPVVSEREEGEVRTDDETGQESEEEVKPSRKTNTGVKGDTLGKEDREEGELTETSTCRSSPVHSHATVSSDEEETEKRTVTLMPPKLVLPEKDPSDENNSRSVKTDTDSADTVKSVTDTSDSVKTVIDTQDAAKSVADTQDEVQSVSETQDVVKSTLDTKSTGGTEGETTSIKDSLETAKEEKEPSQDEESGESSSEEESEDERPQVITCDSPIRSPSPVRDAELLDIPAVDIGHSTEMESAQKKDDTKLEKEKEDKDSELQREQQKRKSEMENEQQRRKAEKDSDQDNNQVQSESGKNNPVTPKEKETAIKTASSDDDDDDDEDEDSDDEDDNVSRHEAAMSIRSPSPIRSPNHIEEEIEKGKGDTDMENDQQKDDTKASTEKGESESKEAKEKPSTVEDDSSDDDEDESDDEDDCKREPALSIRSLSPIQSPSHIAEEIEKGKEDTNMENYQQKNDTQTESEKGKSESKGEVKEKPSTVEEGSSDDDDEDESDDEDDVERKREPALSIRSLSPIQSPSHIAEEIEKGNTDMENNQPKNDTKTESEKGKSESETPKEEKPSGVEDGSSDDDEDESDDEDDVERKREPALSIRSLSPIQSPSHIAEEIEKGKDDTDMESNQQKNDTKTESEKGKSESKGEVKEKPSTVEEGSSDEDESDDEDDCKREKALSIRSLSPIQSPRHTEEEVEKGKEGTDMESNQHDTKAESEKGKSESETPKEEKPSGVEDGSSDDDEDESDDEDVERKREPALSIRSLSPIQSPSHIEEEIEKGKGDTEMESGQQKNDTKAKSEKGKSESEAPKVEKPSTVEDGSSDDEDESDDEDDVEHKREPALSIRSLSPIQSPSHIAEEIEKGKGDTDIESNQQNNDTKAESEKGKSESKEAKEEKPSTGEDGSSDDDEDESEDDVEHKREPALSIRSLSPIQSPSHTEDEREHGKNDAETKSQEKVDDKEGNEKAKEDTERPNEEAIKRKSTSSDEDEEDSDEEVESRREVALSIRSPSPIQSPSPSDDEMEKEKSDIEKEREMRKSDTEKDSEKGKNSTKEESEKGKNGAKPVNKDQPKMNDASSDEDDDEDDSDEDIECSQQVARSIRSPSPIQSPNQSEDETVKTDAVMESEQLKNDSERESEKEGKNTRNETDKSDVKSSEEKQAGIKYAVSENEEDEEEDSDEEDDNESRREEALSIRSPSPIQSPSHSEDEREKNDAVVESEQQKKSKVESEKEKTDAEIKEKSGMIDSQDEVENVKSDVKSPKENQTATKNEGSDDDEEEEDDSDEDEDRPQAALSIRSPSPIQSPDHDMGADLKDDTIRSPSPIQSPEQGSCGDRSGQPAVIPLTIDTTSVVDPRTRRPFMHPVPSPGATAKYGSTGNMAADDRSTGDHTDFPGLPPHSTDSKSEGPLSDQGIPDQTATPKAAAIREGTAKPPSRNDNQNDSPSSNRAHLVGSDGDRLNRQSGASDGGDSGGGRRSPPQGGGGGGAIQSSERAVTVLRPAVGPPSRQAVADTAGSAQMGHQQQQQQEAFFSDHSDAQQQRPR